MEAQSVRKIDTLKTSLERFKRMLMIFKCHIDMVNQIPEYPSTLDTNCPAISSGQTRTTFGDSTKVYVEELGRKLY